VGTQLFNDSSANALANNGLTANPDLQLLNSGALFTNVDQQSLLGSSAQPRNVLIFVADGMRPTSVNPVDTPTLYSIQQEGVNFTNSHSLFPTFTTPNASAIATGHYLGDTGDFSNTVYTGYPVPSVSSPTPFVENDAVLTDIDEKFGGNFLNEETLLAFARQNGYSTAAIGKLGPTLIQDVTQGNRGADGKVPTPDTIILDDSTGRAGGIPLSPEVIQRLVKAGLPATAPDRSNGLPTGDPLNNGGSGTNTTPGTLAANTVQQKYFVDATTNVILPYFKEQGNPFAVVYWSRDPDGTQHNQGDSLNSLTPGINGSTSKAAVQNADRNLAQIIQELKVEGLYDNTDIFITADHGFSTISKQATDNQGGIVHDYAASQTYAGVNPGFLPVGFVAIDIAHDLGLQLYDPNTTIKDSSGKNTAFAAVDPTKGQRPAFGNGLIGGTGAYQDTPDAKVVVAANGGSDLIYVPDKDVATVKKVVDFLSKQDYTSGIFVDDSLGPIAGALPISSINLKGSAQLPTPTIVLNFKSFATDTSNPTGSEVEIADTGLQQGQGMHGNFGRGDTFNYMAAIGPDFKRGYADLAPVSTADVATTLAHILGFNIPSNGDLTGRVITEALKGGPDSVSVTTGILKSDAAANGQRTYLNYQQVGNAKYFDAAGFEGRTVGLSTSLQTDAKCGQKTFTLKFVGQGLSAQKLILTQNGQDLVVTFEGVDDTNVTLKHFKLEDLDNLQTAGGGSVGLGNILFAGQTSIEDSFDVIDANSQQGQIFNRNTVTFLNNRNTTVDGFDNSDDVINAEGGNHKIYGLSGDDVLRGGKGNSKLYGGDGYDTLEGGAGHTTMIGGKDSDVFVLSPTDGLDKIEDFNLNEGDSFDYQGTHFTLLDTDPVGKDWSIPVKWVEQDLDQAQAERDQHIFAIGHKPAYAYPTDLYAPPLSTEDGLGKFYPAERDEFWDSLNAHHAEAMLAAHDHLYYRAQPNGQTWQIIAGNGGSKLESVVNQQDINYYGFTIVNVLKDGHVTLDSYGRDVPAEGYLASSEAYPTTIRD